MNRTIIENQLRTWFSEMTQKYNWLRIKFEYNEDRGVFMVSFYPEDRIDVSDEFNRDAITFADQLNAEYGNEAPLFTDEEHLFKLSAKAECFSNRSFVFVNTTSPSNTNMMMQVPHSTGYWTPDATVAMASACKNFYQTKSDASFASAA